MIVVRPKTSIIAFALAGIVVLTVRAAQPDSPISWHDVEVSAPVSVATARELAIRYLGAGDIAPKSQHLVSITDRDSLGDPVVDRLAYLMLFPAIAIERDSVRHVNLDIYVALDAKTGGLLFAFTAAKSEWASREAPRQNPDEESRIVGWTLLPVPRDDLKSTIVEILRTVFEQYGENRIDAGQTVVRPRWVIQKFPARLVGDELVSVRPPAAAWLVHTMGKVLGSNSPPIGGVSSAYTEALALVADSTLVLGPCGYMP